MLFASRTVLIMDAFCLCCSTAVAIRCKDGVIFAVEKLITSKLHESGTAQRIFTIDKHVGMVGWLFMIHILHSHEHP